MNKTYVLSVKIYPKDCIEILSSLQDNNFCIFRFDAYSGSLSPISLDSVKELDPKWFHYQAIYNGTEAPPQSIIKRLANDIRVINITFSFNR